MPASASLITWLCSIVGYAVLSVFDYFFVETVYWHDDVSWRHAPHVIRKLSDLLPISATCAQRASLQYCYY